MVAVVADSAANIPEPVARELRIGLVPMYLRFGDEVYRDGADLTPADFYDRLVRDRVLASTSTPSPGDFLEAYRATGDTEVVCVTVASVMSAVHQEATLGAERFDGRVEIVDSKSASMAEGFVAMEAARLASNGASLERVAARAREIAGRTTLLATVDTFEFLRRSGRVTKLQAYAATMLDIKPLFRESDRTEMEWAFDLWNEADVRTNAAGTAGLAGVPARPSGIAAATVRPRAPPPRARPPAPAARPASRTTRPSRRPDRRSPRTG